MSTIDPKDYDPGTVWFNQARINYELVLVNRKLIEALTILIKFLQAHGLKQVELSQFEGLLTDAGKIATAVASIDPPGCQGPPPYRKEIV